MEKLYVTSGCELTVQEVVEYVHEREQSSELARLKKLEKYFSVKNASIMNRANPLSTTENAKIPSGYCRYITNTINGYLLGGEKPIEYIYPEGYDSTELDKLFRYNDERFVNTKIGEHMSIYGYAIEQQYIDRLGKYRFSCVDPKNVILLFEDNIDQDIHSAIKYRYTTLSDDYDSVLLTVDYFTIDRIYTWTFLNNDMVPQTEQEMTNIFGDIPFIYYENANEVGDFEPVLDLVDAYDSTYSNISNLFNYFNDAYLVITGDGFQPNYDDNGNEVDPVVDMKRNRCFVLPQGSTIDFLAKPNTTGDSIAYLTQIKDDIHKFSHVPDMTDESFYSSSGVAIRYKLQSLDYLCSIKEANLRKGLTRRFELLSNYLSLKNNELDFYDIEIVFNRNTIEDLGEKYDNILKLNGIVSQETLLSKLPGVDANNEVLKLEEEKQRNIDLYMGDTFMHQESEEKDNHQINDGELDE